MKVITAYPVIIDKQRKSPDDYYLNANDEVTAATKRSVGGSIPIPAQTGQGGQTDGKKKKFNKDKAGEVYGKVKESGLVDSVATLFGLNKAPASVTVEAPKEPLKEGMSTGAKVALIGGGLLLVGGLIYWATKK
jgi:hypothetical protein